MIKKYFDTKNTFKKHVLVGLFSLIMVSIFKYLLDIRWSTSFARVSFILLFLTMVIGPIMRIKKHSKFFTPLKTPWTWRGELGIWFTITVIIHFIFAMSGKPGWNLLEALGGFIGGSGYGFANLLGLIALVLAIILSATSFHKIIMYLGIDSWKWLQSFAYVLFYLVFMHTLYFQFFSTYGGGPDWFGYLALLMGITVIGLQIAGFFKTINEKHNIEN